MADEKPKLLPKLLVVEDDPGLQAQLKWAYDDYRVLIAGDHDGAIELLRAEEPAVVTLDLGLPPDPDGVSEGFATLQEIIHLKPETKVIVASGHGARESALRALGIIGLNVRSIKDITPVPHNGCRPRKRRRV